jgi:hypothetical protein
MKPLQYRIFQLKKERERERESWYSPAKRRHLIELMDIYTGSPAL